MAGERYTQEFKIAAVKQITQEGHSISDVARRLGITTKSLYNWRGRYGDNTPAYQATQAQEGEVKRLKAELNRGFSDQPLNMNQNNVLLRAEV